MAASLAKRTWVEINPKALFNNLDLCKKIAPDAEIMAVVKADAGMVFETVKTLDAKIDAFGVATLKEAMTILPIMERCKMVMILETLLPDERETAIKNNINVTVSSLEEAQEYDDLGKTNNKEVKVHLIVDTGMGRLGFTEKNFLRDCEEIRSFKNIDIVGMATHFPCSDQNDEFTDHQIERFKSLLKSSNIDPKWIHLANSAASYE